MWALKKDIWTIFKSWLLTNQSIVTWSWHFFSELSCELSRCVNPSGFHTGQGSSAIPCGETNQDWSLPPVKNIQEMAHNCYITLIGYVIQTITHCFKCMLIFGNIYSEESHATPVSWNSQMWLLLSLGAWSSCSFSQIFEQSCYLGRQSNLSKVMDVDSLREVK